MGQLTPDPLKLKREDFLLVDDGDDDNILIFATEENLQLTLAAEYHRPSGDLKAFVQMMASVAFCPLTYIRTAWLAIQQGTPNIQLTGTILIGIIPRTNNHVGGWHSRMKKVISKPHPN